MSSAFDINTVSVAIPDPGSDDQQIFLLRAPSDSQGGGLTILGGFAANGATTGAGTTFSYQLLRYSNAGTPVVNGTITAVLDGAWTADVPRSFVIGGDTFIDAGEYVVLDYQETASGNPTNSVVSLQYLMGKP